MRRAVLELLWEDGRPWGPYGLADHMRKTGSGTYPTSLYRVLKTLEDAGPIAPNEQPPSADRAGPRSAILGRAPLLAVRRLAIGADGAAR